MDRTTTAAPIRTVPLPYGPALAWTAVSYAAWHHLGVVPQGFGSAPHGTRIADWVDLLTPYAVLVPVALTLVAAGVSRRTWIWFVLASWAYVDGHGIHLSSNSVGNSAGYRSPTHTAHLWDEYVGHYLWFGAVAVIAGVLATTMPAHARPRTAAGWLLAVLLALLVGFTWTTNSIGGNMSAVGLPAGLVAATWGWRHRADLGVLLLPAGLCSAVLLTLHLTVG